MSKMMDDLNNVQGNKFTAALQKKETNEAKSILPSVSASSGKSPRVNLIGVYSLMGAVLFTGVMSLYLSFNAVIGFKDNKAALENLTSIATEQNKKVKGVQTSLSDLVSRQEEKIGALEKILQEMNQSVDKNDARLSSVMTENSALRATIEDIKNANRDLKIKYSDLSTTYFDLAKEIDSLKKVSMAAAGSSAQPGPSAH